MATAFVGIKISLDTGDAPAKFGRITTAAEMLDRAVERTSSSFKRGMNAIGTSLQQLEAKATRQARSIVQGIAQPFAAFTLAGLAERAVSSFIDKLSTLPGEASRIASETNNAFKGLDSIATFKGIDDAAARKTVDNLRFVKGGILDVGDGAIALKNLLGTGFNLQQSTDILERFSDSAAFGKQAALSYGEAMTRASEGIKNQNSELVDNVGLTKNLSVILKERGFELDDLSNKAKGAAAREALYAGIMAETTAQVGDADKVLQGYSGSIAANEIAYKNLHRAIGDILITNPVLLESTKIVTEAINGQTDAIRQNGSQAQITANSIATTYGYIRAHTLNFSAFIVTTVKLLALTLGITLGSVVLVIAKAIEIAFNGIGDFIAGGLNKLISAVNFVSGVAKKLPIDSTGGAISKLQFMPEIEKFKTGQDSDFLGSERILGLLKRDEQELKNTLRNLDGIFKTRDRINERLANAALINQPAKATKSDAERATRGQLETNGGSTREGAKQKKREEDPRMDWRELRAFAEARGFIVSSTTGGKHNKGSLHPLGYAADVSVKGKTNAEIETFLKDARQHGIKIKDERVRPAGQKVWSAPHLHLEGLRRSEREAMRDGARFNEDVRKEALERVAAIRERAKKGDFNALPDYVEPQQIGGTVLGIEIEPQLTRAQQATKDATERMGESWRDLFVRRENFEQELGEIYQRASLDRQNREMDYIRDATTAEAALHHRRIENANAETVANRRRALALTEADSLDAERSRIVDEIANHSLNAAGRVELAQLRGIRNVQQADEDATIRRMENQTRLARQMDVDSARMNDGVVEFLASQKTLQESLQDFRTSGVKSLFDAWDSSVDKLTKRFGFMSAAVGDLLKNLGKLVLSNLIQKLTGVGGSQGGATPSFAGGGQQGGGFNLSSLLGSGGSSSQGSGFSLSNLIGGGNNNSGGGRGGGILGTIRNIFGGRASATPSFNPMGATGMPVVGGAPPLPPTQFMPMAGGVRLPQILGTPTSSTIDVGTGASSTGSATGGMGGLSGMAGAGLMAGGGMLGGMLGKGAVGQLAGSVGGTLLGGMGAALLNPGTMAAMFSNPVTAIVAGGLLGVAVLSRLFANRTEKALKKEIMAVHQVKMDDMKMLTQIKQIGEQQFGKGKVKDRLRETVQIEQVKELIAAHAEATGQNSKLLTAKQAADPTSAMNNFVRRINGGVIPGARRGYDHIPLLADGGEYVLTSEATKREGEARVTALNQGRASIVMNSQTGAQGSSSSGGTSSTSTSGSGSSSGSSVMVATLIGMVGQLNETVGMLQSKITAMRPGEVLAAGAQENPEALADGVNQGFSRSTDARARLGQMIGVER